jgi:hypothetical protein
VLRPPSQPKLKARFYLFLRDGPSSPRSLGGQADAGTERLPESQLPKKLLNTCLSLFVAKLDFGSVLASWDGGFLWSAFSRKPQ